MRQKLAYLVTEDWYFLSHRLPMARAALKAGFDVHVLTKVSDGAAQIQAEGFGLHPLGWRRADKSPIQLGRSIADVRRLLAALAPSVLHNIALKPAFIGSLAAAGMREISVINSVNGLGSSYLAAGLVGTLKRQGLGRSLAPLLNRRKTLTIVQNPEDMAALLGFGVPQSRLQLIAGSGIDTVRLSALPEPPEPVVVTYVGRMLADKGLRSLMAAHRLLRERGVEVRLQLAGTPDPENASSISQSELEAWAKEPGVTWLGHVTDIGGLWAGSHIAVLASRREGLPLSLLEASACGRPMVATDVPGCREVVRHGETGLLVPLDDPAALAGAIAQLAGDAAMRKRMGLAARRRAESVFSAAAVGEQTAALYLGLAAGRFA